MPPLRPRSEVRNSKIILRGLAPLLRERCQLWELLNPHVGALSGSWFRISTAPELDRPRKFVNGACCLVLSSVAAKPDRVPSPWVFQG